MNVKQTLHKLQRKLCIWVLNWKENSGIELNKRLSTDTQQSMEETCNGFSVGWFIPSSLW